MCPKCGRRSPMNELCYFCQEDVNDSIEFLEMVYE